MRCMSSCKLLLHTKDEFIMEKTVINIQYDNNLSEEASEFLTQLKGEWMSREEDLIVDLRVLFDAAEDTEDLFNIKSLDDSKDEITLVSTEDEQIALLIALSDPFHIQYQVTNIERLGTSRSLTLEKR